MILESENYRKKKRVWNYKKKVETPYSVVDNYYSVYKQGHSHTSYPDTTNMAEKNRCR